MKRIFLPALAALVMCAPFAFAQPEGRNPVSDVRAWYRQFLGREADQSGLIAWTDLLRQGVHPAMVLASILGSDEYFARAGNTREGYVRTLFIDLARREPTAIELRYWTDRMSLETNRDVAYALLLMYPRAWERPGES